MRQVQVTELLLAGFNRLAIARKLCVSKATIYRDIRQIFAQEMCASKATIARDARQIDEKLFFDVFAMTPPKPDPNHKRRR